MKTTAMILVTLLGFAALSFAQEYVPIELPKVAAPATESVEAEIPVKITVMPDGSFSGALDVLLAKEMFAAKKAESEWTGFHPALWWKNNVQPRVFVKQHPVGTLATVAGVTGLGLVADHNDWFQGGGGSSSKSEAAATPPALPTTVGGSVYYFTASGDNSAIVYSAPVTTMGATTAAAQ